MEHTKCQRCHRPGVDMFDVCHICGWENDPLLEAPDGTFHRVGFDLTSDQRRMWSEANGEFVGTR